MLAGFSNLFFPRHTLYRHIIATLNNSRVRRYVNFTKFKLTLTQRNFLSILIPFYLALESPWAKFGVSEDDGIRVGRYFISIKAQHKNALRMLYRNFNTFDAIRDSSVNGERSAKSGNLRKGDGGSWGSIHRTIASSEVLDDEVTTCSYTRRRALWLRQIAMF